MGGVLEALAAKAALPAELGRGTARVTLTGGEEVRIENRTCLLSFAPDCVEIGCGKLRVRVRGSGLRICAMDREELLLRGKIMAVEVDGA
jgi:sporulation protein YqfC